PQRGELGAAMSHDEILGQLFAKFGLHDGDLPGSDDIQSRFSRHLQKHGFENSRICSMHNRRVCSIRLGDRWLSTEPLSEGPPSWSLEDSERREEVPVPARLSEGLPQFLPLARRLIILGRHLEAEGLRVSE